MRQLITSPLAGVAAAIVTAAVLVNASLPGPSAYEVELMQQDRYCESVATWNAETARGVSPERRYGHPDYDGIADTACAPVLSPVDTGAYANN
ncbi:hypothetical protein [Salinicola rhizosphaerae]|uniref:Excalibur calcium-binding domain-containing protein n=1 Tax=Salinicola rhizosphaerae TaxID=1443141 RepID=A0ABQ3E9P1_9GAMM|nr:hypothetical protein [Salinicola rhizosphaerae]GHB30759.1 hypothetical protein GCM10009038_31960 [Salinicola rhizosphaerae]